jgi:uncharacterized protein (DUF305 family)
MKTFVLLAVGALSLASVSVSAQTQHPHSQQPAQGSTPGPMHGPMHMKMHETMHKQMHGTATHGASHGNDQGGAHAGHGASSGSGPRGDTGASSQALHAINVKMHEGMTIAFTGNTDVDFVKGMIPHHQGAVDMAKVLLAFGKDPELRKLAEAIIKAQESEIAFMQEWLRRNTK